MWIIRILNTQVPCWVADYDYGDPPRTLLRHNAQMFGSEERAEDRILEVRKTHPLKQISYQIEKY